MRRRSTHKLKPGDLVRIIPYDKIVATLDEKKCHKGLLFAEDMVRFCGGEYEILDEVKWVYDECSRQMLRCKDIVVLKDVICSGKNMIEDKDCDRSCMIFWKTTWLEKV